MDWSELLALAISASLGGLIGIERHLQDKPAGLRTNILICLGACLFTIISTKLVGSDPGRIAAQIVTGIGFLGAGAIIQSRGSVHGLTTAAVIWVVAAIGVACGAKFYTLAVETTAIVIVSLVFLLPIERKIGKNHDDHKNHH